MKLQKSYHYKAKGLGEWPAFEDQKARDRKVRQENREACEEKNRN
jgi:hypothetical protein